MQRGWPLSVYEMSGCSNQIGVGSGLAAFGGWRVKAAYDVGNSRDRVEEKLDRNIDHGRSVTIGSRKQGRLFS